MRTTIRLVLSCAFLCSQLVGAWAFIGTDRQRDEQQTTTAMTSPGTGGCVRYIGGSITAGSDGFAVPGVYRVASAFDGWALPPIPGPEKLDTKLQQAIIDALIDDSFESASVNIRVRIDGKNQKSIDLKKLGLSNIRMEGSTVSGIIRFVRLKALADHDDVIALMLG
jgi:hypothetical protein